MIADIILTLASLGFVFADLKQAYKLWFNTKYDCSAFSKTHFRVKILSLIFVVIAYVMLGVHIALSVAISQLILNIYILRRIGGFNLNLRFFVFSRRKYCKFCERMH